jgi:hypothetical protein
VINLADPPPGMSDNHQHQQGKESGNHGNNGTESTSDTDSSIDPEGARYWRRACAALPPMTPEEIAAVAVILRRIDARRGQQPPQ